MHQEKYKIENSLIFIFGKIWLNTTRGLLSDFGATLKIHKKSNFDRNQFKLLQNISTYMCIHVCIRKNITIEKSLLFISIKIWPMTQVQGLWPNFEAN